MDRLATEHNKGVHGKFHMAPADGVAGGCIAAIHHLPVSKSDGCEAVPSESNMPGEEGKSQPIMVDSGGTLVKPDMKIEASGASPPKPPKAFHMSSAADTLKREHPLRYYGEKLIALKRFLPHMPEQGVKESLVSCKNDPKTCFHNFVEGGIFSSLSNSAILANTIYIGYETNIKMETEYTRLTTGENNTVVTDTGEYFFTCFFVTELLMRMCAQKGDFVWGKDFGWNCFDTILILMSLIQMVANTGSNLSVFRIFRIFRLVRVLKLIHRVPALESLKVMVHGIMGCTFPLLWTSLIIVLIIYAFGVFFMSIVAGYLSEVDASTLPQDDVKYALVQSLHLKFGSMYKIMCLLFEGISGGDPWASLSDELKEIGEGVYMCFAIYVIFVTLGVLNIVTGFFVDGTIEATNNAKDEILRRAQDRKTAMIELIGELFHRIDDDESGMLSWEELENHLHDDELQEYFLVLEMDPSEAKDLFRLLDINGSGQVNIDDFTNGCLRIMGTPRNLDICACMFQGKRILLVLETIASALSIPVNH